MSSISSTTARGNILIIDDNPDNLRLLSNMLTEQGYKARSATNGKLALASVHSAPPDLILLDITMPSMNGYEVCKQLKADEQTRDIPVIFISALDEVLDKVKAFSVGGVDYITKPFQFEEVLARVKTHLALHRFQQHERYEKTQTPGAERLIPHAFLDLIQPDQTSLIQSSAYRQQSVTVLAVWIRTPSQSSREALPDTFQSLQSATRQISPVIREHHGHIIACGAHRVVAMFPQSASHALQTARALQQVYDVNLSMGIHTAHTLLGLVDDGQHLHPVIVPDATAIAAHLARLAEGYQPPILISEAVLASLEDMARAQYQRCDAIHIPGYAETIPVFSTT
jgi:DNA-binding response OmpR family regulator